GSRLATFAFKFQQRCLAFNTPAIAGQCLIGADDAMAGNQQPDWIAGASAGNRAGMAAEVLGQLAVAPGLAAGYLLKRLPDPLLESTAAQIQWQSGGAGRFLQLRDDGLQPVAQSLLVTVQRCGGESFLQLRKQR